MYCLYDGETGEFTGEILLFKAESSLHLEAKQEFPLGFHTCSLVRPQKKLALSGCLAGIPRHKNKEGWWELNNKHT